MQVSINCNSTSLAPKGFSLAQTQEEFSSVGSKTSETKHFLKTFLCFLTSTYLLPKTYKVTISDMRRQPRVPGGPKGQVRGTREHGSKSLSLHYGTMLLSDGLSMLTPCFMTRSFTSHPWSFSEKLILSLVFIYIPETNSIIK